MASKITIDEFNAALARYETVLETRGKAPKAGATSLKELDHYRYVEAPARFAAGTGKALDLEALQKLMEWKLLHGKARPSLPKLIASNSNEIVEEATKDAFAHYATFKDEDSQSAENIKKTLEKLSGPLKGVGPATASLILAVHDPDFVYFFSDEAYAWLVNGGARHSLKYSVAEYLQLCEQANMLADKLGVSALKIEKVAFVLIRENDPVYERAGPYVPTGLPRGRPKLPESEKKHPTKPPSGLPRGRPRKPESEKIPRSKGTGRGRGRPPGTKATPKNVKEDDEDEESPGTPAAGKKRSQPPKANTEEESSPPAPSSGKRKVDETPPAGRAKRAKA